MTYPDVNLIGPTGEATAALTLFELEVRRTLIRPGYVSHEEPGPCVEDCVGCAKGRGLTPGLV